MAVASSHAVGAPPPSRPLPRRSPPRVAVIRCAAGDVALEHKGGRMVAELVGAFNELADRMVHSASSSSSSSSSFSSSSSSSLLSPTSSSLLFRCLKLSIPLLHSLPFSPDGRTPLSRALSLASLVADLHMDAEVISAAILRVAIDSAVLTLSDVRTHIGTATAHLVHESIRIARIPSTVDILDNDTASSLRKFCLSYYDIRAIVLELSLKLDLMRNLHYLPTYDRQVLALQILQIYAPLAHAIGTVALSLCLEDLSFRYLFPSSYLYLDNWLIRQEKLRKPSLDSCKAELFEALVTDPVLKESIDRITIKGRYKSRFSTMKKLLRDGRRPEQVHDLLGLRIIMNPKPEIENPNSPASSEIGDRACYRTRDVIRSLWKEVPSRTKDYISRPKENGYRSLHVAVDPTGDGEANSSLMEIQIRTSEMDSFAEGGTASHSLYKAGLTDPEEAKRLKAIMMAAAEFAAARLQNFPVLNHAGSAETDGRDRFFNLLDKNGDGRISIEELKEVVEELGAEGEDAEELMELLDANSDGSLSSDEFDSFQKQVRFMRNVENKDDRYRALLGERLPMTESTGLIQVYSKELNDRLTPT